MDLKFCVDVKLLSSAIALGFSKGVEDYDSLTDDQLRTFLDKESEASKAAVNLDSLDTLEAQELKMDMSNRNASSPMRSLFVAYHSLLYTQGYLWIVKECYWSSD